MTTVVLKESMMSVDEAFAQALELFDAEQFAAMADLCRKIVAVSPGHWRALNGIGIGLHRTGRSKEAIGYIRKALELNPAYFEAYNSLGNILREMKKTTEALKTYQQAESLRPDAAVIQFNLANVLSDLSRHEEALARYERAITLDPSYTEALLGRARILYIFERYEESCVQYHEVLTRIPDHCEAMYGVGMALTKMDQQGNAEHFVEEAANMFRNLISRHPRKHDAILALGNILSAKSEKGDPSVIEEAISCYRRVLDNNPKDANTRARLGSLLVSQGKVDEALDEYRLAIRHKPDLSEARSCYVMYLQYHLASTMRQLAKESAAWQRTFAAAIPKIAVHRNRRDPERPLRIGYVSADFRSHPVGFHLMPVLYHHDAKRYKVFCYDNRDHADIYTCRLRNCADQWRTITNLTDESAAEMIMADKIDILVDLAGHTAGNRLLLFARRPAPVQVTWLGYFFSTGLTEIDYIFMDDTAVLQGEERWFSERVARLPGTRFCYEPPPYAGDVSPLPAYKNGRITFGSFNNLAKVTPQVISLWAKVLRAVPGSRLLLKSAPLSGAGCRESLVRKFAAEGVGPERLILRGQSPHAAMFAEYGDMDIALDPFPFNGGITSCEALWMGVPVLTLVGNIPIARQTSGFLKTIGLSGFTATDEDKYCELAVTWAADLNKLSNVRKELRDMMARSLLCDGKRFTANLEGAYRQIWRTWCSS